MTPEQIKDRIETVLYYYEHLPSFRLEVGDFRIFKDVVVLNNQPTLLQRLLRTTLPPTQVTFMIEHREFSDPLSRPTSFNTPITCAIDFIQIELAVSKVISPHLDMFWADYFGLDRRTARKIREIMDNFPVPEGCTLKFFPYPPEMSKSDLVITMHRRVNGKFRTVQNSSHTAEEFFRNHKQIATVYALAAQKKDEQIK